jgi:hypothetical protein
VPDADPGTITDVVVTAREPRKDGLAATMTMGNLEADAVFDRTGSMASARIPIGPATLDLERVYVGGTIATPAR